MFPIFVPLQILPIRDGGCCESLKIGLRRLPDDRLNSLSLCGDPVLVMGLYFRGVAIPIN